jgi:uracil-DNA glycosylase
MASEVKIEASWKELLTNEFGKDYFIALSDTLKKDKKEGKIIYPPGPLIFNAFNFTPFPQVKVVILGQDPYHGPGQAHGLSFSVPPGIAPPPSLQNIYKEIHQDLGISMNMQNGTLEPWAKQGVLLLNASLTVLSASPMSHSQIGWHIFTDTVIQLLSQHKNNLVFMLWGKFAQSKASLIDGSKHLILKAAHPSPFSAYNGFMGCKHFSTCNTYLAQHGLQPINWAIV